MKKILALSLMILAAVALLYQQYGTKPTSEVHFHAGFQIYQNNTLFDFTALKYQNFEPCSEDDHDTPTDPTHEQIEKAHLHNNIGDVVHVHRPAVTWQDLFTNLKVEVDSKATGYINGLLVKDFLNTPITAYDSLVVFEGENTDIDSKRTNAVTKDHIVEVETTSETCGS